MIYLNKPDKFNSQMTVISCLYEVGGKILFLHKNEFSKRQPNRWGVPSGKVRPGEEIDTAMLREFNEETGRNLDTSDLKYLRDIYVNSSGSEFTYHLYRVTNGNKFDVIIDKGEHQDYCWVTPEESLHLNLIEDMEPCIKLVYGLK